MLLNGGFLNIFFSTLFHTASSAAHQMPLCRMMLVSSTCAGQLRFQLTTRLDLIHTRARSLIFYDNKFIDGQIFS